jgi:hypothetical protein
MTHRTITLSAAILASACAAEGDVGVCSEGAPESVNYVSGDGAEALLAEGGWLPAAACDASATPISRSHAGRSATVTLSGNAFVFGDSTLRLPYATVTIEEAPGFYAVTNGQGAWSISGLPGATDLTPKITFPNALYAAVGLPAFQDMHQQTFRTHTDTDLILFQSVPQANFQGLAALAGVTPDPDACQVVTTVAEAELGDIADISEYYAPHGLAGVSASLVPASGAPDPIYFNDAVLPDASLAETSGDGGVLWGNVEAGRRYRIQAHDEVGSATFEPVWVTCEAGRFINASPPRSVVEQ